MNRFLNKSTLLLVNNNFRVTGSRRCYSGVGSGDSLNNTQPIKQEQQHYDVVIVGGGLVGSSMACALGSTESTKHLRVALIESAPVQPLYPLTAEPDLRTLSFNHTSVGLFDAIGAWSLIKDTKRTAAFNQLKVWDASGGGGIHFQDNTESMGYILENRLVTSALLEASKQYESITIKSPASVKSVQLQSTTQQQTTVTLANNEQLTTDLIIAADGGNSIIKKQLNLESLGKSYNQKAVVCTIKLAPGYQTTTLYQRFLPTGPIAMLPLADGYASIIWSTNVAHANYLLELDDDSFMVQMKHAWLSGAKTNGNNSIVDLLHNVLSTNPERLSGNEISIPPIERVSSKRASFPLRLEHTKSYTQRGLCLIGDAAHVVHPMAGQGVNLGLADVIALTQILSEGQATGYNVGNEMMLERYQENRKLENIKMMASIDTLFHLFGSSSLPITAIRNLGLTLLDNLSPLKSLIMSISKGTSNLQGIGKEKFKEILQYEKKYVITKPIQIMSDMEGNIK
ncbi:monooxygenase [Heterostelium album PN500]|uniref:Ubiquinone biosynthesis monooxygenase COQ6, mitochondrial n=1 Tax=Heterostelium pallidum (strain ATCC 26659 / Pp 5 / PN500) TaxID=670386 RepID=D3B5F4_HETP5|nr:monooxygenase [Heterostelium album PN500]EFA83102.1 monooxygenase [Heterostelium album PN500]|eukprot:XP_020435219.1 monooxygenase [Heterostelium album PN500]